MTVSSLRVDPLEAARRRAAQEALAAATQLAAQATELRRDRDRLVRALDAVRWRTLPLASPLRSTGNRETLVRATWADDGLVPLDNQDSGSQSALVDADWLIRCPAGQPALDAGQHVMALPF